MKIKLGDRVTIRIKLNAMNKKGYGKAKTGEVVFVNKHYYTLMMDKGYKETVAKADLHTGHIKVAEINGERVVKAEMKEVQDAIETMEVKEINLEDEGVVEVKNNKRKDTEEEKKIRDEIKAAGFGTKISPETVKRIPKDKLSQMITDGLNGVEIAKEFGISGGTISVLRQFYGLPKGRGYIKGKRFTDGLRSDSTVNDEIRDFKTYEQAEPDEVKQEQPAVYQTEPVAKPDEFKHDKLDAMTFMLNALNTKSEPVEIPGVLMETEADPLLLISVKGKADSTLSLTFEAYRFLSELKDQKVKVLITVKEA